MKINYINVKSIENAYKTQSLNKYSETRSITKNDRVELSSTAKYLSKINSEDEKIDSKKIEDLKKRIESGTYNIDSKNIAKKILENIQGDKK